MGLEATGCQAGESIAALIGIVIVIGRIDGDPFDLVWHEPAFLGCGLWRPWGMAPG